MTRAAPVFHHVISSSPYTTRFLRLLEDHPETFPPEQHCFWIERAGSRALRVEGRGRIRRFDVSPWGFVRAFSRSRSRDDRVILHQLSNPRVLLYLWLVRGAARRCAWSIWGGDVYYDRYRPRTWPHALRERLRRAVIPTIPVVSSFLPGDVAAVRALYGSRARDVRAFYPVPTDLPPLPPAEPRPAAPGATFLVGNSGDPTNEHAAIFRALARFGGEDVRILSPLSYGDPAYVRGVIELGRELFGDRFTPLTEFLPPDQYAMRLRDVDVVVMNHGHQQALGNVVALLMLGKKVFVRGDTTSFEFFRELGIQVFDTRDLEAWPLARIVEFPAETGTSNAARMRAHLSEENAVAGWRELFAVARDTK